LSPADFYVDLVYTKPIDNVDVCWRDLYLSFNIRGLISARDGVEVLKGHAVDSSSKAMKKYFAFYYLFYYFFKIYGTDLNYYYMRLLVCCVMGLFFGSLQFSLEKSIEQSHRLGSVIFTTIACISLTLLFSIEFHKYEQKMATELIKNGITSPALYCITQGLASIPFNVVLSTVYVSVVFWLSDMSHDGSVFVYVILAITLVNLVEEAMAMVIVESFQELSFCTSFQVSAVGLSVLFAGYYVSVADIHIWLRWLAYINPHKVGVPLQHHLPSYFSFVVLFLTSD